MLCYTLMCLYQHPKRFYHLVLLCRLRPDDVPRLRNIYCRNGTYKPNEWVHLMVVVILLHLNCFAQYALCGLNLRYPRSKQPAVGVDLCISDAIAASAIASMYDTPNILQLSSIWDVNDMCVCWLNSAVFHAQRLLKQRV